MASKNYGQIGVGSPVELGKGGAKIQSVAGVVEARNNANDAFAVVRAATPVNDNDVATKAWVERRYGISVTGQIDGGSPPAAGTPGRIFLCTTAGGTYTLDYLYRDDGATWNEIIPVEGMTIGVTDALSGGTHEFSADHVYIWDLDATQWDDIGPSSGTDAQKVEERAVQVEYTDGVVAIGSTIPANATVLRARVYVSQAFDGVTPTIVIGDAVDPDRLLKEEENDPETVGLYVVDAYYKYGGSTQLNCTVTTSGASQGIATVVVEFANT
jgi:hypothetical protein